MSAELPKSPNINADDSAFGGPQQGPEVQAAVEMTYTQLLSAERRHGDRIIVGGKPVAKSEIDVVPSMVADVANAQAAVEMTYTQLLSAERRHGDRIIVGGKPVAKSEINVVSAREPEVAPVAVEGKSKESKPRPKNPLKTAIDIALERSDNKTLAQAFRDGESKTEKSDKAVAQVASETPLRTAVEIAMARNDSRTIAQDFRDEKAGVIRTPETHSTSPAEAKKAHDDLISVTGAKGVGSSATVPKTEASKAQEPTVTFSAELVDEAMERSRANSAAAVAQLVGRLLVIGSEASIRQSLLAYNLKNNPNTDVPTSSDDDSTPPSEGSGKKRSKTPTTTRRIRPEPPVASADSDVDLIPDFVRAGSGAQKPNRTITPTKPKNFETTPPKPSLGERLRGAKVNTEISGALMDGGSIAMGSKAQRQEGSRVAPGTSDTIPGKEIFKRLVSAGGELEARPDHNANVVYWQNDEMSGFSMLYKDGEIDGAANKVELTLATPKGLSKDVLKGIKEDPKQLIAIIAKRFPEWSVPENLAVSQKIIPMDLRTNKPNPVTVTESIVPAVTTESTPAVVDPAASAAPKKRRFRFGRRRNAAEPSVEQR